ncbi:PilZ domain-containing protein [candidate division FCPU426 bacterium]|nr:PilZ domain-containing protein [candidate division FCPU426 bacterium]
MEKERRRSARVQPVFRVRTEILPETGDIHMAVFADIINLSEQGICLRSPLKLAVNDRLIVYLPILEEKNPLEIHGLIRWIRSGAPLMYEYGMKFIGIDKVMETTIRAKIKDIMHHYYNQKVIRIHDRPSSTP